MWARILPKLEVLVKGLFLLKSNWQGTPEKYKQRLPISLNQTVMISHINNLVFPLNCHCKEIGRDKEVTQKHMQ